MPFLYQEAPSGVRFNLLNRASFPQGHTSAVRLKALLLHLEKAKGGAAADAWIEKIRVKREDLYDETRLFPLGLLHLALREFVALTSEKEIGDAAVYLIAKENLGAWARVLRSSVGPAEALVQLEGSESEYGRTIRWETLAADVGHWKGRVHLAHDPRTEEDQLLAKMRVAELSVVPMLFGFERAHVTWKQRDEASQDFDVTWLVPSVMKLIAGGAVAGGALGSLTFAMFPVQNAAIVTLALMASCAAVGANAARARDQKRSARAQTVRGDALERSLVLKEERETTNTGDLEGSVVAGLYRLGERMGSGASGVIYKAVRISDGTKVAIKLLRAAALHDVVASDRLRREAEALGLSWHPNVVEVLDHGRVADGTAYLVMELLEGESLASRLRRKGRLTTQELGPIALEVAEALVAVHAAGVVHRDLKPSNIFLVPVVDDPSKERTKVLDFGIARVEWEEMRITNLGSPMGTPGYMSPEQEAGADVDGRSDIFALGAVLYECLVGDLPPAQPDALLRAPSQRPGAGPAASGVQKSSSAIPPEWRGIVQKALMPNPDDRYPDARAFLYALRRLIHGDAAKFTIPPVNKGSTG